jgi:hypothetical protein
VTVVPVLFQVPPPQMAGIGFGIGLFSGFWGESSISLSLTVTFLKKKEKSRN